MENVKDVVKNVEVMKYVFTIKINITARYALNQNYANIN